MAPKVPPDDGAGDVVLRPVLYVFTILAVIIVTFSLSMRWNSVFACPANAYSQDYYLGYCQAKGYGDYDHGAFWFGLEPTVHAFSAAADVLFIGNSRMQFGFSAPALEGWFTDEGFRFYLLGFSHEENATFIAPLLRALRPKAQAYVINVDQFFTDRMSPPGQDLIAVGSGARARYVEKRNWQRAHRFICSRFSSLCGNEISFYRKRDTGEWRLDGSRGLKPSGMDSDLAVDQERVARDKERAERFIADLPVDRRCVFLTYVPTRQNERATAAALASVLDLELISPDITGLQTFDGSHLDRESAEKFVSAFLEIGGPRLLQCLNRKRHAPLSPRGRDRNTALHWSAAP